MTLTSNKLSEGLQQIQGALLNTEAKVKEVAANSALKAGNLSDSITSNVQNSVQSSIQTWLDAHPILAWVIAHPIWSFAITIVTVWLSFSLLTAIADAFLQLISSLLKLPFHGFKWLFLPRKFFQPDSSQQLMQMLDRLEALRREQDELLGQVKAVLETDRQLSRKLTVFNKESSLNSAQTPAKHLPQK